MKIVDKMIVLSGDEEREIIEYGLSILLDGIITITVIMALGILFGKIVESCIFLLFGIIGTSTLGGFHCKTKLRCMVSTLIMWGLMLMGIYELNFFGKNAYVVVLSVIMLVLVAMLAPAQHENKPLTAHGIHRNKTWSLIFCGIVTACICVFGKYDAKCTGYLFINYVEIVFSMMIGKGVYWYAKRKNSKNSSESGKEGCLQNI